MSSEVMERTVASESISATGNQSRFTLTTFYLTVLCLSVWGGQYIVNQRYTKLQRKYIELWHEDTTPGVIDPEMVQVTHRRILFSPTHDWTIHLPAAAIGQLIVPTDSGFSPYTETGIDALQIPLSTGVNEISLLNARAKPGAGGTKRWEDPLIIVNGTTHKVPVDDEWRAQRQQHGYSWATGESRDAPSRPRTTRLYMCHFGNTDGRYRAGITVWFACHPRASAVEERP